jgi:hypothetical protein
MEEIAAPREHRAPFGRGGLGAKHQKAQARRGQQRIGQTERRNHHHGRHDIGQEMAQNEPRVPAARRDRPLEIGFRALYERRRETGSRVIRNPRDSDSYHCILQARTEHRHTGERDKGFSERKQDIGATHQHRFHPSSRISGDDAERHADSKRNSHRDQADLQRQARA